MKSIKINKHEYKIVIKKSLIALIEEILMHETKNFKMINKGGRYRVRNSFLECFCHNFSKTSVEFFYDENVGMNFSKKELKNVIKTFKKIFKKFYKGKQYENIC